MMMVFLKLLIAVFFLINPLVALAENIPNYDRELFGRWADEDRDCLNTRHEMLAELSTGLIHYSSNGCRVVKGRWLDPYTDQIFRESSDLDIDHLVPLYWAWQRGAWVWSNDMRKKFSNDRRNLFAVDDGVNRAKSADGPLDWLPPHEEFRCQYVSRFWRIVLIYELEVSHEENHAMEQQRKSLCI
jgi:hypothetical protein